MDGNTNLSMDMELFSRGAYHKINQDGVSNSDVYCDRFIDNDGCLSCVEFGEGLTSVGRISNLKCYTLLLSSSTIEEIKDGAFAFNGIRHKVVIR